VRFDEVELSVPDLEAARAFYTGVLQLAELPTESGLALAAGRTRLTFRAAPVVERPRYHIAFSVPLARFDAARPLVAAHAPLITADGDVVSQHQPGGGARSAPARPDTGQWLTLSHRRPALPLRRRLSHGGWGVTASVRLISVSTTEEGVLWTQRQSRS
jgi:catechol 2,3-dioxygenase-like lactoylglutathione lyase family enzyme